MKTQTSKKSILIRTLLILPLFALLLYGFSTTVQIPKEKAPVTVLQEGATKKQLSEFNSLAKKYNATPKEKRVIPSGDLKKLEGIYGKMTEEQKADAQPFPECPDPKPSHQEDATKKQVGEYNKLAKKYNEMLADNGNIRIKKSDVDRLEYLYSIMTEEQRAEAEPFPDFPEPPEPPTPPTPPDQREVEVEAEVNEHAVEEIIETQEIYDVLGGIDLNMRPNETKTFSKITQPPTRFSLQEDDVIIYINGKEIGYREMMKMESEGMNIIKKTNGNSIIKLNETDFQPPSPPAPPKPKSPLELLEDLKKDNVKIILDGKEIDYEEAEKRFEESSFTRVNVRKDTGGRPVLEVSTD